MRKFWKRFLQSFDSAFYKGNSYQYLWILSMFLVIFLLWLVIAPHFKVEPWRIVELMLDPGSFANSEGSQWAIWIQFFITLTGAVIFTSFIINVIGNSLGRRLEAFTHGRVTYRFQDHILIFGSNAMLLNIVKALTSDPENEGKDIVIVTVREVEEVREYLFSRIPESASRNIFVLYGDRTIESTLTQVEAADSRAIYILGEDDEKMHDALNLECWSALKSVCGNLSHPVNCFLVLERLSTEHLVYSKSDS